MRALEKGRLRARLAENDDDLHRSQELRHLCFRGGAGRDADSFDDRCRHLLVEEAATGRLMASFRVLAIADAEALLTCYSAQFYGLEPLQGLPFPAVEMGRFCVAPGRGDPDILRLAWAAMTRLVDDGGFGLMIGCTSFHGADPARHAASLAALVPHVAPPGLRPAIRATESVALASLPPPADPRAALAGLPPILRTYLGMGGRVSDHAVIDRDLDTLHVFTLVEVAQVPPARARALRALAG